ncbi:MAG: glycoside hydrolase family 65 protein [Acidimicrobiales bacterium]
MIEHEAFPVEPWSLTETAFDPEVVRQSESLFSLSNGYLGLRGNLEEDDPVYLFGTYLGGFYETYDIRYGERLHGQPEQGQTLCNVTDGKVVRLSVDGEQLDVRTSSLASHRRRLDLRAATLARELTWHSASGALMRARSLRLVSLAQPHLAALRYEVACLEGGPAEVLIASELVADERNTVGGDDPRELLPLGQGFLLPRLQVSRGGVAVLAHTTRRSGLTLAVAARHDVYAPGRLERDPVVTASLSGSTACAEVTARLAPGQQVRVDKLLSYHWSLEDGPLPLAERAAADLDPAAQIGFDQLSAAQRRAAEAFWTTADVEIDGDPAVQQGARFGLFQLLQATAQLERGRGVPAKGLTGPGYEGHTFWDTDLFVLPALSLVAPELAARVVPFRARTLPEAREIARAMGLRGALYPWRTIDGGERSAYFPAGTAACHVVADVAGGLGRYLDATGDRAAIGEGGAEVLVETARLWASLGHLTKDAEGDERFRIDEVTGPDEYSVLVDNNVYTNLMAEQNLRLASRVVDDTAREDPALHATLLSATGLQPDETGQWRRIAAATYLPFDEEIGVHPQDEHFTTRDRFPLEDVPAGSYPLLLHYHPLVLYSHQVVKQADLVLALWLAGERFSAEEKRRDLAYYEPLTAGDSSLSACPHAVVAAEVGRLDDALAYLRRSALVDLDDLSHNVRDGIHLAAVAGSWLALAAGLAGVRHSGGRLRLRPQLPESWERVRLRLCYRGRRLELTMERESSACRLLEGPAMRADSGGASLAVLEAGGPALRLDAGAEVVIIS